MKRKLLLVFSSLLLILILIAGTVYAATLDTKIIFPAGSNEILIYTKGESDDGLDKLEEEESYSDESEKITEGGPNNSNSADLEYWDPEDEIPASTGATGDIFLNLDGIEGSSVDARHRNQIDVLSYSFGGRSEPGKTVYKVFRLNKKTDASSPKLFQAMIDGNNISSAVFEVRKAGANQVTIMKITLSDVSVVSYKQYCTSTSVGMEEVLLGYSRIDFSYYKYDATGSLNSEIKASGSLN